MDLSEYKDLFISEALEHLQTLNQMTLALEQDPDSADALEQIFRSAHTIKGMAATMGYADLSQLAHALEDLLDRVRRNEQAVTPSLIELAFAGVDGLSTLVDAAATDRPADMDMQALIARLQNTAPEEKADSFPPLPQETPAPEGALAIHVTLADDCQMRSLRAYMVLERLRDLGEVIGTKPPEETLTGENFEGFCVHLNTSIPPDQVQSVVEGISEVASVRVIPPQDRAQEPKETARPAERDRPTPPATATSMVRVNVQHLDLLLNLVSELVISRGQLLEAIHIVEMHARRGGCKDEEVFHSLGEALDRHDRTLNHLHESVLQVRMVPVSQVFDRFPRMMRDLLQELGKEVRFEVRGQEVEIDRVALESLADPLVHLLRNAADHGLESPEERERAGKAREGIIRLSAERRRGQAIIEVTDDGRGLDVERILETAVQRGLVPRERSHELSRDQALMLICEPGFSLSEQITDVSGRGVGMNVVKRQVETLQGALEIETQPGQGTTFRLLLPLSLALTQAMIVRVREETYAVPLHHIEQTIEIEPERVQKLHRWEMLRLDSKVLPIFDLGTLLGAPNGEQPHNREALVVKRGSQQLGLVVDDLIDKQEIVVKPLPPSLTNLHGLSGTTILGAGQVVLILDIPNLVQGLL